MFLQVPSDPGAGAVAVRRAADDAGPAQPQLRAARHARAAQPRRVHRRRAQVLLLVIYEYLLLIHSSFFYSTTSILCLITSLDFGRYYKAF